MKKVLFSMIVCTLLLSACNKDDDGVGSGGSCTLSAKIDGDSWCGAGNYRITSIGPTTTTSIGAGNSKSEAMSVNFLSDQPGTYDLANGVASYITGAQKVYQSTSGTLIITAISASKISGTFSFEAKATDGSTISVTDGKFDDLPQQ